MGYSQGKKPYEWASKSQHSHIIRDEAVNAFIDRCVFPADTEHIELPQHLVHELPKVIVSDVQHILAVDGSYTEVEPKKTYPSSRLAFFQFGALLFNLNQLKALATAPFIFPEDMAKFKNLERFKLTLPIQGISVDGLSLRNSVRKSIYEFFIQDRNGSSFMESLAWFLFGDHRSAEDRQRYKLGSSPIEEMADGEISLNHSEMKQDFTFDFKGHIIYLTDAFRLHEAVDNDHGAGGILGYVTNLVEQIIIVHYVKALYQKRPELLRQVLFLKDGPLAFFGQTANMHKPMRDLFNFLEKSFALKLVGLEKSGAFVDHAKQITHGEKAILGPGKVLLLENNYIYRNIIPGHGSAQDAYGSTSYYGAKVIFRSAGDLVWVASLPTPDSNVPLHPKVVSFAHLDEILSILVDLRCDMYENSLVPVAMVNQLVSLANHPSSVILEKFARDGIQ